MDLGGHNLDSWQSNYARFRYSQGCPRTRKQRFFGQSEGSPFFLRFATGCGPGSPTPAQLEAILRVRLDRSGMMNPRGASRRRIIARRRGRTRHSVFNRFLLCHASSQWFDRFGGGTRWGLPIRFQTGTPCD